MLRNIDDKRELLQVKFLKAKGQRAKKMNKASEMWVLSMLHRTTDKKQRFWIILKTDKGNKLTLQRQKISGV